MPDVFDRATGQKVDLPPDQAAAGLASGALALNADGGSVALAGKSGKLYSFSPEQVASALATGGYRMLSPEEELKHRVASEERAKGVAGSLQAGAESGLNQLLLGVPEAIREGEETPDQAREREARERYHSTARLFGGAAGVGASLLFGGELFKGAELAGEAVSRGVLPAAEAADAALHTRLASKAVDLGVQGAALASPVAAVQAFQGNPNKAAETLLWGIGAGAVLGGIGELGSSAATAAVEKARDVLSRDTVRAGMNQWANNRILKAVGAERSQLSKLGKDRINELADFVHDEGLIKPGMGRQDIGDLIEAAHDKYGKDIADAFTRLDEHVQQGTPESDIGYGYRSTTERREVPLSDISAPEPWSDEKLAALRKQAKAGEAFEPVRLAYNDSGELVPTDGIHRITVSRELGRSSITADVTRHELAGALHPGEMGSAIKGALDSPELRMPMNADQAHALDLVIDSANHIPTSRVNGREVISFDDAQKFVSSLRRKWSTSITKSLNEGGARGIETVTPLDQMKAAAYQSARNALHVAAKRTAEAAGEPEIARAMMLAKEKYSKLAQLEKFAGTLDRVQAGNRMMGITDFLSMGHGPGSAAGMALGAGLGSLFGPAGAMAGSAIGKVGGIPLDLLAKHWMEDKGLVTMGAIAKRAAKDGPAVFSSVVTTEAAKRLEASMETVRDTVKRMAQEGIQATGARRFEHMAPLLGGDTSGLSHEQQFARLGSRLAQLGSNPVALASAAQNLSLPFGSSSPAIQQAYAAKIQQAIQYLSDSMPRPGAPPPPFAPQDWSPSPKERLAFHDRAEIIVNPMRALEHMERGTLSSDHIHALSSVYPEVYASMRQAILSVAAEHPDLKLPLRERQSMAQFLGMPLDRTSQYLPQLQASYAPGGPGATPQGPPPGATMPKGKIRNLPSQASAFAGTMGPASQGAHAA